jgi:hypothetical protein
MLASIFRSEAYWMAVVEYFPQEEAYVRKAKQELALIYLRNNNYAAARRIFDEFANLESVEEDFRAFGLAGLIVLDSVEQRHEVALHRAAELAPLREKLDPRMGELLSHAIRASLRALNRENDELWQQWQNDRFGQPSTST